MNTTDFCSLPRAQVEEIEMQDGWFERYAEHFYRDRQGEQPTGGRHREPAPAGAAAVEVDRQTA